MHGRLKWEQRHRRQPERSIPTLREDLSRQKLSTIKDLLESGSYAGAREKGLVRMEGKEYVVKDGDVILFRFNV